MRAVGILCVFVGAAIFVLPLFKIYLSLIYALGDFRPIAAVVLILIGVGIFLFSSGD